MAMKRTTVPEGRRPALVNQKDGILGLNGSLYNTRAHKVWETREWLEFPDKLAPERVYDGPCADLLRAATVEGFSVEVALAGEAGDMLVGVVRPPESQEDIGYFVLGQEVAKLLLAAQKGKTYEMAMEEFRQMLWDFNKQSLTS